MIKKRLNIRMSGLGGQGAVTAAHVMAMAANRDGKFSISNPFFGAESAWLPRKLLPESVSNGSMIAASWCSRM